MARPLINSPRMLRTGQPLSLDQIRGVAPAVFAEEPHSSRGPRYAYVPTITPLQALLANGWGVYECAQQRSRTVDRDPYTKHMLRMRKVEHFDSPSAHKIRDLVPEVCIINGHDGSAAYRVAAAIWRRACSNGLMVGERTMASFIVRHTVGLATSAAVLEAGERTVIEKFPKMLEGIDAMQKCILKAKQSAELAGVAMRLRYGDTVPPFPAEDLLTVRRDEDKDPTLWNMLNRIQENIMNGGWETRSAMFARKSTVRPVERVSAVAKINGGLWDAAMELVEA